MRGWCATGERGHGGFTKWIRGELWNCETTLRSCGIRLCRLSRELRKKNTKRRNCMAPEMAQNTAIKRTLHVDVPIERAFQGIGCQARLGKGRSYEVHFDGDCSVGECGRGTNDVAGGTRQGLE